MSFFRLFFIVSLLIFTTQIQLCGQAALKKNIAVNANGQSIEQLLYGIENQYKIYFTYSKRLIPVDRRIDFSNQNISLKKVLDYCFEGTAVIYEERQGRIVLKIDKDRQQELLAQAAEKKKQEAIRKSQEEERRKRQVLISMRNKEEKQLRLNPINTRASSAVKGPDLKNELEIDWSSFQFSINRQLAPKESTVDTLPLYSYKKSRQLAQVSVFPDMGTNRQPRKDYINNFSLNVFWGSNGGLDGIELGGLVNHLSGRGIGLQVAGLGNAVGGRYIGAQLGGLFNVTSTAFDGLQLAGLFNIAKDVSAIQAAGLFNISSRKFNGLQVGGLFNVASSGLYSAQVAGFMNASSGIVRSQFSGVFNFAGHVKGGQVAGFLNVARRVDGLQIALINVADTIAGTPIGLFNFIGGGYNRIEFSANETFLGNFALKIGVPAFYNILILKGTVNRNLVNNGGVASVIRERSWALGYGIGTGINLSSRFMLTVEAAAAHVNEAESWTDELNLLTMGSLSFDMKTGRRSSIFLGPTWNVMISRRKNAEGQLIGSDLMPHTIYDKVLGGASYRMWWGFSTGFRI